MTISVPLRNHQRLLIDDEDLDFVLGYEWFVRKLYSGHSVITYVWVDNKRHIIFLDRQLVNAQLGDQVKHKNNDNLDCRRSNLNLIRALTKEDVDYIRYLYDAGWFVRRLGHLTAVSKELNRSPATILHIARYEAHFNGG
jgi:hypothetical protein